MSKGGFGFSRSFFFAGASNGFALELEIDNLQEWSNTESWT